MTLVLYHSLRSTCSRRVRNVLALKGLDYESRVLNLQKFEHHAPDYLRLNPNGYVPTLVHDGVPLIESTAINEYLDEVFPEPPLRPGAAIDRLNMRVWTKFADEFALPAVVVPTWSTALAPSVHDLSDEDLEKRLDSIPHPERRARWRKIAKEGYSDDEFREAHGKLVMMVDRMETSLSQHRWLAGDALSLADTNLLPYVVRAGEIDADLHDHSRYPLSQAWLDRMKAFPWYSGIYG